MFTESGNFNEDGAPEKWRPKRPADEDVSELPEVDQNAKKDLRSRHLASPKAKRS